MSNLQEKTTNMNKESTATEATKAYEAYRALHRQAEDLISQCDRLSDRVAYNEQQQHWSTASQLRALWKQKKQELEQLEPRVSEARDKWVTAQLAQQRGGAQWNY